MKRILTDFKRLVVFWFIWY